MRLIHFIILSILIITSYVNPANNIVGVVALDDWELPVVTKDVLQRAKTRALPKSISNEDSTTVSGSTILPSKRIPQIVWMAVRSEDDKNVSNYPMHLKKLIEKNPQWSVYMQSNTEKDLFMNEVFKGTSLLWAYNSINPLCGAAKADIWRYAVLYLYGGFYVDDDSDMGVNLDGVIHEEEELLVSFETNGFNGNRCYIPTYHLSDFATIGDYDKHKHSYDSLPEELKNQFKFVIPNWAFASAPRHIMMLHLLHNLVEIIRHEYLADPVMRDLKTEHGW